MQYIQPLTLVSRVPTQDEIGNTIFVEETKDVFCQRNVVGTKEFYNATAVGITPTAELQMRVCDYDGQDSVIFKDERYSVIRTIPKGKFDVVLVIGLKAGNKNETNPSI